MIKLILNFLFPPRCSSCGAEGILICDKCRDKIIFRPKNYAYRTLDKVYILCQTTDLLRKIVHQFKYNYKESYKELFINLFIDGIKEFGLSPDRYVLLPIPLHYRRKFMRGFNQSELIALGIAEKTLHRVWYGLKRSKNTVMQSHLNKKERKDNLKNAFEVQNFSTDILSKRVLLIDDIMTTGETLNEACLALRRKGFKQIEAIVLSRGTK